MEKVKIQLNTYSIVLCALFSALIVAGAFIKIPLYTVPITLQAQFVLLAGLMLGSKRGAVSVVIYIIIGLAGVPVFARGGGVGYILQPTFGYILGFIFGAYITGIIVEKADKKTTKVYFLASFAGLMVIYIIGVAYFWLISVLYLNKQIGGWFLLVNCFLITLPGDIIFSSAGAVLAKRLKPLTVKYSNL